MSYNEVLNNRKYHTNTKIKNAQLNSDEHFSLNNILCCCEIKISVNQHLNSSLSKAEEQPSVCTGIMKTAAVMAAHTHTQTHTHRYPFTGIMPSINTAVTHTIYI